MVAEAKLGRLGSHESLDRYRAAGWSRASSVDGGAGQAGGEARLPTWSRQLARLGVSGGQKKGPVRGTPRAPGADPEGSEPRSELTGAKVFMPWSACSIWLGTSARHALAHPAQS